MRDKAPYISGATTKSKRASRSRSALRCVLALLVSSAFVSSSHRIIVHTILKSEDNALYISCSAFNVTPGFALVSVARLLVPFTLARSYYIYYVQQMYIKKDSVRKPTAALLNRSLTMDKSSIYYAYINIVSARPARIFRLSTLPICLLEECVCVCRSLQKVQNVLLR